MSEFIAVLEALEARKPRGNARVLDSGFKVLADEQVVEMEEGENEVAAAAIAAAVCSECVCLDETEWAEVCLVCLYKSRGLGIILFLFYGLS